MKKALFTLILILGFTRISQAQTLIYSENFSGSVSNVSANTNNGKDTWSNANSSTPSNYSGASAGQYASTMPFNANTTTIAYLSNINTTGYIDIKVSWGGLKLPGTGTMALAYSVNNGATFTTITGWSDVTDNGSWQKTNGGKRIALPAGASNVTNVTLRWTINIAKNHSYSIDDLLITGASETGTTTLNWADKAEGEDPFVASSPTSATPYTLDGVTMRMSKTVAAGVNLTTAKLNSTTFQSPVRSLTLIQNNATPTYGTEITTQFSKAVSDLSFTLFDVDRNSNQFLDVLTVEGYLNGAKVNLQKNEVITTNYNEFIENTNTIKGMANGINVAPTSSDANVIVKFSSAIDRVVITYKNAYATAGTQGVAINNMNWKATPAPLPVTLVSFTGKSVQNKTELQWLTSTEKNNEKFVIERSKDGRTFERIGTVKGNGTTNELTTYTFTDANPANGLNYYRLKQMDSDGTTEYSKMISVKINNASSAEISVYPIPVTDVLNITLQNTATADVLTITNMAGKVVSQLDIISESLTGIKVPVNNLPVGYYMVQVNTTDGTLVKKFVKN